MYLSIGLFDLIGLYIQCLKLTFDLYQLEHMKLRLQDEVDEKEKVQEKNTHLESELKALKKLEKSVQRIDRSKKKLEHEFASYKVQCCHGYKVTWCQGHMSTKKMVWFTFCCQYLDVFCSFHRLLFCFLVLYF